MEISYAALARLERQIQGLREAVSQFGALKNQASHIFHTTDSTVRQQTGDTNWMGTKKNQYIESFQKTVQFHSAFLDGTEKQLYNLQQSIAYLEQRKSELIRLIAEKEEKERRARAKN